MRTPFCQFCRKRVPAQIVDGDWVPEHFEFDYDEWHAILCGIGDGLRPCLPNKAWELHEDDWHYYLMARGITSVLWAVGLILLAGAML